MDEEPPSNGDDQGTPDVTEIIKEFDDQIENRREIRDDLDELSRKVEEIREDLIHPRVVRLVLEDAGVSEPQATDLVETMQETDRRMRGATGIDILPALKREAFASNFRIP